MAKQGFISHDLPSGNVFVRMTRAGYNYETVSENVARTRTISYAHNALLESPGHKANILDAEVTHVGIGIAKGDPAARYGEYIYIVELFALPRKVYEPSQIKELLTSRIEKMQRESLVSAKQDAALEKIATGSLRGLNDSYSNEDLHSLLEKSADELLAGGNPGIFRLYVSVQSLDDPDKFRFPDAIRQGSTGMYGTAVRRITDNGNCPSFLVLTLVGISR
jgi:hypothetical protein